MIEEATDKKGSKFNLAPPLGPAPQFENPGCSKCDEVLTTAVSDDQVSSFLQVDGEQKRPGRKPDAFRHSWGLVAHFTLDAHTPNISIIHFISTSSTSDYI